MSQADSEHGDFAGKVPDECDADSGFLRGAGAGREENALRVHGFDFHYGELVVAADYHLGSQFPQILDEVIGEGIVVVEDEDHCI
jgi:hypothetical protein